MATSNAELPISRSHHSLNIFKRMGSMALTCLNIFTPGLPKALGTLWSLGMASLSKVSLATSKVFSNCLRRHIFDMELSESDYLRVDCHVISFSLMT